MMNNFNNEQYDKQFFCIARYTQAMFSPNSTCVTLEYCENLK